VTLVEFADLQCPFCRQYTEPVMPELVTRYVRTGKLRMVFRDVAFIGTDSVRAGQMAGAASLQNRLWTYVDLFYLNQKEENSGYVTDDFLRQVGRGVKGLDVEKAMADRGVVAVQHQLDEAQAEWQANGFQGTPSFLVGRTGGTLAPLDINSFDVGQFTTKIDGLLAKAQ
jgi:protein-disulfide isomerase